MTKSPANSMFFRVSFFSPLLVPMDMQTSGGFEVMPVKKLKGARLKMPSSPTVETQAMGRGKTILVRSR